MYKVFFLFHGNAKIWLDIKIAGVVLLFWTFWGSCISENKGSRWLYADFIRITPDGKEQWITRVNDFQLLKRLDALVVSEHPHHLCPLDKLIRFTDDRGRVTSVPLSLCQGNAHAFMRKDRQWNAWRIDKRLLPLLDSLFWLDH
ncbi:MAG: hypothetical protein N2110_06995 [Flavobacteriales bacterium]|nr:hypothetical protein [Flavobacteriales bacterium]MCX7768749.1 hypothetical protein [Flavobacteriales bacterium]MDW8409908.1 hypothetical protein [Flavobacteriales bacterium]